MSSLLKLSSRLKAPTQMPALAPAPAPAPAPEPVAVVEVPTVKPEPFLSVSESVEVAPQSTSLVEEEAAVTEAPSEEQCASLPAPASTASSHTESSSE